MNAKSRTDAKKDFEKYFFKLMTNAVSGKTMQNVRKHRDNELVTTDKRREINQHQNLIIIHQNIFQKI